MGLLSIKTSGSLWLLTVLLLLQTATISSSSSSTARFGTSRILADTEEPSAGSDGADDPMKNLVNDENLAKAQAASAEIRKALKEFRNGNSEFYVNLLKSLFVQICQNKVQDVSSVDNPSLRFVEPDSPKAYKDEFGNCIKVLKPEDEVKKQYNDGKCEVKPNCYWGPINATVDEYRYTVYDPTISRYGALRDGDITVKESEETLQNWAQGIGMLVAPGLVLAALTVLTLVLFLFCRCCCNQCGGRDPNPNGYRRRKKLIPAIFHLIFSAGIIATLGASQLYNAQIMDALSNTFINVEETLYNSTVWILAAQAPLKNISSQVSLTVQKVQVELDSTEFVEGGLTGITSRVEAFGADTANVVLPRGCDEVTDPICYPCEACKTIDNQVQAATKEMDDVAAEGVEKLRTARESIGTKLVDMEQEITDAILQNVDKSDALIETLEDTGDTVANVRESFDEQEDFRRIGFTAVFALFIVVLVLSFVGMVFGMTPCTFLVNILHIAYLLGFITLLFGFLVSSLMLAFSLILNDVCEMSEIMQKDWAPIIGDQPAQGLNACFRNQSLLDAYNLSGSFEFQDQIKFPDTSSTMSFDFSTFDSFRDTMTSTDSSTFQLDQATIDSALSGLNTLTGMDYAGKCTPRDGRYTLENIPFPWTANNDIATSNSTQYMMDRYDDFGTRNSDLGQCTLLVTPKCTRNQDPCNYQATVLDVYLDLTTLLQIQTDAKDFTDSLNTKMVDLDDYVDEFKTNISTLENNMGEIQDELVSKLFTQIDLFKQNMYCDFIPMGYNSIKDEMCGGLLSGILMISLLLLLASLFLIPVTICNIILCKRLKAPGDGSVRPDETEFK